jgi:hypothetical protein
MKIKIIIGLTGIITLLSACTKYDSEFTDIPVIEAYLRPGESLTMTVRRQIPFSSDVVYSSDNIDNLSITIRNNDKDYLLTPLGDGKYATSSLIVSAGERYELSFTYNSKNVSAYTEVPLKPLNFIQSAKSVSVMRMDSTSGPPSGGRWEMPEPLTLTWDNDDGSYYIVVVENAEEILDPVRDFGDEERPEGRFRKAPTTAAGLQMRPQEFQYFGQHRLILNHVLPDYASLYDETSSSSQNLTNPSTSIINGYGIFTGLNADTLYLDVDEQ